MANNLILPNGSQVACDAQNLNGGQVQVMEVAYNGGSGNAPVPVSATAPLPTSSGGAATASLTASGVVKAAPGRLCFARLSRPRSGALYPAIVRALRPGAI